ncbi:unnamed protein product [Dicrocoelium dendriticum]|nr:unnamed protein product [Dicrocoelium dendriticum]
MVLIIHGFPNEISALRFEWAWQNPNLSRRLAQVVPGRSHRETPFDYRFRVLSYMLRMGPWNRLGLVVRWLNQQFFREFDFGLEPPLHIPVVFGPFLPTVSEQPCTIPPSSSKCGLCGLDFFCSDETVRSMPVVCPSRCSNGQWHMLCIARHLLSSQLSPSTSTDVKQDDYLIPVRGPCPSCISVELFWPTLIEQWKRNTAKK